MTTTNIIHHAPDSTRQRKYCCEFFNSLLEEPLFDSPDKNVGEVISVTQEMVEKKLSGIVKDRDLSKYIL